MTSGSLEYLNGSAFSFRHTNFNLQVCIEIIPGRVRLAFASEVSATRPFLSLRLFKTRPKQTGVSPNPKKCNKSHGG